MTSRLTVVLVSLLLVALLLETAALVWICVVILPTRMAEQCSDECRCDPERYNVDSSSPSLAKTSFTFLKYLRNLKIYNQYIPFLENDTFLSEALTDLEEISVQFSQLRTIELGALNGLTNLKLLDLNGNEISEILPGTFEKMRHLQYLLLSNNSIEHLNIDVFSGLISLILLDLRMNKLQYINPNTFVSLPNLKGLLLSYNPGLQIPTDRNFINLHSLSYLAISRCDVNSISVETLTNVSALEYLDLSSNNLKTVDINILRALPKLSSLYLYDNPLQCDCQLQEVWRWCEDRNVRTGYRSKAPECDTPREVEGMWWGVLENGQCLEGNIQYYGDYTNTNNNYTNIYDTYTDTFTDEDMET